MSETTETLNNDDILDFIMDDDIEGLKKNIDKFDLNAELDKDDTALGSVLHHSIYNLESEEFLDILLEAGADINRQNEKNGQTPLHIAIEMESYSTLKYLLNKGADYSIPNKFRKTPKEEAIQVNNYKAVNIIEFFDKYISKREAYIIPRHQMPIEEIMRRSIWYNVITEIDLERLTAWGINKDISFFGSALHTMVAIGNRYSEIDLLIANGADINHLSENEGNTPLHLAVQMDGYGIAEHLLLEKGANPFIRDKHDFTCIDYVSKKTSSMSDMINDKIMNMAKDRYFDQMV